MSRRKKTPTGVETKVLVDSVRRCCLCFGLTGDLSEKSGQIAHLDRDPSNSDFDNLAYLCLPHHDQFDSRTSQSKGLTIREVKHYRELLYKAIEDLRASRRESAAHKDPEGFLILARICTGKELVSIARDAELYMFDNDEPEMEEEMHLLSDFFQCIVDYCEDLGQLSPSASIRTSFYFNSRIDEIEQSGFKVFGKRVHQKTKALGILDTWDTAIITVIRPTNPTIIDLDEIRESIKEDDGGV